MPFLLDTCTLSEFITKKPDRAVVTRVRTLPAPETFIPAIAIGEIQAGIAAMAPSRRKEELEEWFLRQLLPAYEDRVIPFAKDEALRWGQLQAQMLRAGHKMAVEDTLIAAIALTHNLTLVTRNETDFVHSGVQLYNPWK